jgi:hypothetical protein
MRLISSRFVQVPSAGIGLLRVNINHQKVEVSNLYAIPGLDNWTNLDGNRLIL